MSNYFPEGQVQQTEGVEESKLKKINSFINAIKDTIQRYRIQRWICVVVLVIFYIIRVTIINGYYALTYCIGINVLNSFIGFISPLEDPEEVGIEGSFLPQKESEEFRPFQRKVKEYTFWESTFFTLIVGIILTFFDFFDVPVFWPLLLLYFLILFIFSMRNQIKHMIKYKYVPWDFGRKTTYTPKK